MLLLFVPHTGSSFNWTSMFDNYVGVVCKLPCVSRRGPKKCFRKFVWVFTMVQAGWKQFLSWHAYWFSFRVSIYIYCLQLIHFNYARVIVYWYIPFFNVTDIQYYPTYASCWCVVLERAVLDGCLCHGWLCIFSTSVVSYQYPSSSSSSRCH